MPAFDTSTMKFTNTLHFTYTSKFEVLRTLREKTRSYQKIIINSVLNDISSMYIAGVCTVGAFVCVH